MAKGLTVAAVEKFRADPKRRREIPDAKMPGLYLIVQPSGAKSWCARYRHKGASRKLTLGGYPVLSLIEARTQAQAALLAAQRGGDPAHEKRLAKKLAQRRTEVAADDFEGVARGFIKRHHIGRDPAKPHSRTWRKVARYLGFNASLEAVAGGLTERWGERKIGDITRTDVRVLLADTAERAPIAANRLKACLHKMFAWAVEVDLITANPCAGIKPPAREVSRERVLSGAEIVKFWRATETIGEPFGRILKLLLITGCRLNEVAGMTRAELSEDGTWTIPGARTKNGRTHVVPLPPSARDILTTVKPIAGGLMFTTTGSTPISGWSKTKQRLDATMKITPWRLHDLRRTAVTGMAELGIRPDVIELTVNHVSGHRGGIAGVYNRSELLDERRAALERWAKHVAGLVSGKLENVVTLHKRGRK